MLKSAALSIEVPALSRAEVIRILRPFFHSSIGVELNDQDIWLSSPQEVWSIDLETAATSGLDVGSLRPNASLRWRYLVGAGNAEPRKLFGAGDMAFVDGKMEFVSSRGDEVMNVLSEILEKIDELANSMDEDYVFRFLEIPGIYIEALWLMPISDQKGSAPPLFVPLKKNPAGLQVAQKYDAEEFMGAVIAEAKRRISMEEDAISELSRTTKRDANARRLS